MNTFNAFEILNQFKNMSLVNITMEEKLASNANYMRDYRKNLSVEKKQKMLDYQKSAMKAKRDKERAEKLAQGIAIKIGRPKKQTDMTTKEMKDMIDRLKSTIQMLETKISL
jgi:hypothetical protein